MGYKKSYKKRFGAAALAIAMTAGLAACGSAADQTQTDDAQTDSAQDSAQTEEETATTTEYKFKMTMDGIATGDVSSGVSVHDPSIIKDGDTYYIFGSHMTAAKCDDLLNWESIADGYTTTNPVYGQIYDVKEEAFAYAGDKTSLIETDDGGTHVWAPDVIYNKTTGLYYMYYCTSSTWNASNLCYGTSENVEGPYEWQGALIYSGFDKDTIKGTDVLDYVDEEYALKNYVRNNGYDTDEYPNAIDPTVFYDEDDRMWMVYGSWSGGIFLLEIDLETGKVIHPEADEENSVDAYFGKRLLGGGHKSIEGPYIMYDEADGYYYLFVSYGNLTSSGGYQVRVFRSETVDGEYVDMNGAYPLIDDDHQLFGLKLTGNYKLPSLDKAYMATGHNSAFIDDDGKMYLVYHTRFNDGGEGHSPRVHQMFANEDGWLCELPYQTQGETISQTGYDQSETVGRYFVINQGTDISSDIANPVILYLNADGTVVGRESSGTWEAKDGSYYMNITIDGEEYKGVFCQMKDEAGTDVMTFSAVGANKSVWGVSYGQ
jgi:arabinan endo-1,5-alpha-L-arabinosidase